MNTFVRNLLLAGVMGGAGTIVALAGTEKGKCPKADASAAALLKGVTHLTDDDVRFRTKDGHVVLVDPVAGPTAPLAIKSGAIKPDLILITHSHGDHFQPAVLQEYIAANPAVILAGPTDVVKLALEKGIKTMQPVTPGREYTLAGITFETVPAYFSNAEHHPRERQWVGYVLQLNGARYYVTGDTEPLAEMADVKADVVFPLLYGCGGNTDQALKMAKLSHAAVIVPVHHGNQVKTIAAFLQRLPENLVSGYFADAAFVSRPPGGTAADAVAAAN